MMEQENQNGFSFQNVQNSQNGNFARPMENRLALARKYRPKSLQDLVGQDVLVQALTQGIKERCLPQAILLSGIRGTGKTSTARILARSVNCLGPDGKGDMTTTPCGVCASCLAMDNDSHVDVLEMDAASHTGVDDIREIIESARYKAVMGHYKVFIIDEVHMLSKSAFNALLKTLEEPPSHVLFVFATTEVNKVPETILSRCAHFELKRIETKILMDHLNKVARNEGYSLEPSACALLLRSSEGSVRDSLTLLDQAMTLVDGNDSHKDSQDLKVITASTVQNMIGAGDRQKVFCIIESLLNQDVEKVISNVRSLIEEGIDPLTVMQDVLECLYQIACFKMLPTLSQGLFVPEFERDLAVSLSKKADAMQWLSLWKVALRAYQDIKSAPFVCQALEMGLLRICFASKMPSIEQLLQMTPQFQEPPSYAEVASQISGCSESQSELSRSESSQEEKKQETQKKTVEVKEQLIEPREQDNRQEYTAEKKDPQQRSISSEEDLFTLLDQNKEILLLSCIKKDIAFISFDPTGLIRLQIRQSEGNKSLPLLKKVLTSLTGINWRFDLVQDKPHKTFEEKKQDIRAQQESEMVQHPLVQELTEAFPEAKVEFI